MWNPILIFIVASILSGHYSKEVMCQDEQGFFDGAVDTEESESNTNTDNIQSEYDNSENSRHRNIQSDKNDEQLEVEDNVSDKSEVSVMVEEAADPPEVQDEIETNPLEEEENQNDGEFLKGQSIPLDPVLKNEQEIIKALHQNLVSNVVANQQEAFVKRPISNTKTLPRLETITAQSQGGYPTITSTKSSFSSSQLFAQNPADGQFYSLTPIQPQEVAQLQAERGKVAQAQAQQIEEAKAQHLAVVQSQTEQLAAAHAQYLQIQAQIRQIQATQAQQLQAAQAQQFHAVQPQQFQATQAQQHQAAQAQQHQAAQAQQHQAAQAQQHQAAQAQQRQVAQAQQHQAAQAQQHQAAQAQQHQAAQAQKHQAAQAQQLEEHLASIQQKPVNQEPHQFYIHAPLPEQHRLQYVQQPAYLVEPQPATPSPVPLVQLLPIQYVQHLQQHQPTQRLPSHRQVVVQQTILTPESFSAQNPEKLVETHLDKSTKNLVTEVGLRYTPVQETAQYTIYRVKDPKDSLNLLKTRPVPATKFRSQANGYQQLIKSSPLQSKPIKIVPAPTSRYNYTPKPTPATKPAIVYKSAVDPAYYNAVKSRLISSFSNSRVPSTSPGGYGPPKPVSTLPPKYGPHGMFRGFAPFGFVDVPSRVEYKRKPFRPSPIDLSPFPPEPLFEPIGHNGHIAHPVTTQHPYTVQPTTSDSIKFDTMVHPARFSSKYVDIDYSPGISLPPNEAAFAAIQARRFGGPAFIDPGYLTSALGFELNGKILEPLPPNREDPVLNSQSEVEPFQYKQPEEPHEQSALPDFLQQLTPPVSGFKPSQSSSSKSHPRSQSTSSHPGKVQFSEIDVGKRHHVPPRVLAQLLKESSGDDIELENYY